MPKAIIIYDNESEQTKLMANDILRGFKDVGIYADLTTFSLAIPEDLLKYDTIIFGSPCYYGTVTSSVKGFMDATLNLHGKLEHKIGGAFSVSANIGGGVETTIMTIHRFFLTHGMIIQGDPLYSHYGPTIVGESNFETRDVCRRYGYRLAQLTERL